MDALVKGPWHENNPVLSLDYHCVCCAQRRMSLISHIQVMLIPLHYLRTKYWKQPDRPIYNNGEVVRSDKPLGTPGFGFKFSWYKDSQVSILLFPK